MAVKKWTRRDFLKAAAVAPVADLSCSRSCSRPASSSRESGGTTPSPFQRAFAKMSAV